PGDHLSATVIDRPACGDRTVQQDRPAVNLGEADLGRLRLRLRAEAARQSPPGRAVLGLVADGVSHHEQRHDRHKRYRGDQYTESRAPPVEPDHRGYGELGCSERDFGLPWVAGRRSLPGPG